jgi:DNA-binding NarL/FixJ family response regulator
MHWPGGLSTHEVEVLHLVAPGFSNAEMLALSERTVAHHGQHGYTKLGVSTRAAAALYAVHHGLVSAV